ncbi:transcription factor IIIA [Cryptomeria japonica]|uniref:transcription factor IIIA n=1 Tax=Cryptomeria japonica TaxID=3369 RepID=UPI0027DA7747|nr:transcription factor IIIA [Cryptomeria japonica]XP_059073299.1 transcription factor IIIA [Cryptomeria japonica]
MQAIYSKHGLLSSRVYGGHTSSDSVLSCVLVEMVAEGDFENAMEDELIDLGTEVSKDSKILESTQKNPEDCKILESEEKKSRKVENNGSIPRNIRRYCCQICGFVRSKRKRLIVHIMSDHGVEVDIAGEVDKLIKKKNPEDYEIFESKLNKSRKAENNGSKLRDIRRYCCQICGLIRCRRKRLKDHIMLHHGVAIDTVEIDKLIEKKSPEDREIPEAEGKKSRRVENNGFKVRKLRSYCCTLCGLVRSKRKLLENHIILEHSGEMNTKGEMDKFIEKRRSEDDQRGYSCQICGVLRSKRVLLELHMLSSHGPEALKSDKRFASKGPGIHSLCVCNICRMSFAKPSHLQQHKLSHSALRSFACPIVGCLRSYKRQDHLNRHLLKHEGELVVCPKEDCKLQLSTVSNLKRHLNRHRERGDSWQSQSVKPKETTKKHICPDRYCDKAFKYPSKLAKHLDDVHSTKYTEIICCEPGCLKYFTNAEALKEHLRRAHNHICCEVCGSRQLKKQIKRHMRIHENQTCVKSIACPHERCLHNYTTKSNLRQHIKSVHLELKPFKCQFGGCGMTFAHKSARDKHELSGTHCYVQGDFIEEDAAFQSRPRGGRKRKAFTIDSIFRKRVAGPDQSTVLENGFPFMDWLMSDNAQ